jgi:TonB family protein
LPVVDEASARAGVSAHMALSDDVAVPAAFGLRRPLVLLPARFLELAEDAQRAVLCHELVHVRRRDWLQMIAEETARALLWFHPAVWWLLARVRLAREQVVDEEVVHLTRERRVYLETLVGLAGVSGPSPAAAPLFLTESHLKSRIEALLEEVKMSKTHLWTRLVVSVAGVALAGAAAAWAFPLESAPSWFAAARTTGAVGAGEEVAPGAAAAEKKAAPRKPKVKVDAVYPTEAKTKGVEGSVVMDVWITAAGDVKEVKATKGPEELTRAAVDALRQWKFEPAAHETRATMTMRFVLDK